MKKKIRYTTAYRDESRMFYMAVSCFCIVFVTYIYFVSTSVAHVVMRKETDLQIRELRTELSLLESEYIEIQHSMSTDVATQNGYTLAQKKVFIDTTADTLVLSGTISDN